MESGRDGRDEFLGSRDPFARVGTHGRNDVFGARDPFAGFAEFSRPGSLISSFFRGGDPFDDPFFSRPFGGPMMGPSMFGPSLYDPMGAPFGEAGNAGFLERPPPQSNSRGPVITELDEEEGEEGNHGGEAGKTESIVQEPDEKHEEGRSEQMQHRKAYDRASTGHSQSRGVTFHSSSVTYGGINGAYYSSSRTGRIGSDGITVEESKEADKTTGKATHRISRGIHDKGHTVTRELNSDGKVDTTQTLHNLNEDELVGFDEAWSGNARQQLPGWNSSFGTQNGNFGSNSGNRALALDQQFGRGWARPANEQLRTRRTGKPKTRVIPIN